MKYKAVIFDIFGTLVDIFSLEEYRVFIRDMCAVLGVSSEAFLSRWDETADDRALGRVPVAEQLRALCRGLGVDVTPAQLARAVEMRVDFVRGVLVPRGDAVKTLGGLKARGLKVGVISDCSEEVVAAWPDTPLAPLVDAAVLSAAVGMKKPDPRVYELACERLGVEPAACLFVGDGGSRELTGASSVGMDAVLIRTPEDAGDDAFRRDAEEWDGERVASLTEVLALAAQMEIRPYEERDEAAVAALWREVFAEAPAYNVPEEDIRRKLAVQRELFFVAEEGGDIVGTALAGYDGHRGWVHLVAVKPSCRRRGIGATLMARVEEGLRAMGCPKLNLQVRGANPEAVAFYERLGYAVEDRVSMGKRLEGAGGADERASVLGS